MSGIDMSLLDEQELGRQFEEALNNGELGSLIDTDVDFSLPEETTGLDTTDGQFGDGMNNYIFDQSTDFGLLEECGGPVQVGDFTTNAPTDFTLPNDPKGLDTTDGQFRDVADNNMFEQPMDFGFLEDWGGPAPIDFTLPADYQVSQYPALENLDAPSLPYFHPPATTAADFNYPLQPLIDGHGAFPQDQGLWDPTLNGDPFDPG
ncbi:MAG: hypothetical protein Q9183_005577, partial [Haloplaca sp. 2 TL-2023]